MIHPFNPGTRSSLLNSVFLGGAPGGGFGAPGDGFFSLSSSSGLPLLLLPLKPPPGPPKPPPGPPNPQKKQKTTGICFVIVR